MKVYIIKYLHLLKIGFKIITLTYFLLSFFYFIIIAVEGRGDELLFINDLKYIHKFGWIEAIEKGVSVPYMLIVYPFSMFLREFIALRIINLLLLLCLFLYFLKIIRIRSNDFYYYIFFFLGTSPVFFMGTNDALFYLGMILFMTEVFYFIENKKMNSEVLAFSGLVIFIFTRELYVVYLPIIFLSFYYLYKNGYEFISKSLIFPIILALFFFVLNIPSLKANNSLSYDVKLPPKEYRVSWSQRQYLAQLLVNRGDIDNYNHPSWEQTQEYLNQNGPNSLPEGIFQGIIFDYNLTIKEFFKDLYYLIFFGFRQLSLILLFPFYYIVVYFLKQEYFNNNLYIPYCFTAMVIIFSFIIISFVELRWLFAVFMLSIIFYNHIKEQVALSHKILQLNYFIVLCFSLLGIFGLVKKVGLPFI